MINAFFTWYVAPTVPLVIFAGLNFSGFPKIKIVPGTDRTHLSAHTYGTTTEDIMNSSVT